MISLLQNISSETIRQNWSQHSMTIDVNSPIYEILWNSWYKKYNIDVSDTNVKLLQNFIMNKPIDIADNIIVENETLILKDLTSIERKKLHLLCDKIGLHHKSINPQPRKKQKRNLCILKPVEWLWEFTIKNPYSNPREYYEEKNAKKNNFEEKMEKMYRMYCNECGKNGTEVNLCCSPYIRGLYCDDCIETTSDGDGDVLGCHKFESIYDCL